jgi:hypothetical protein
LEIEINYWRVPMLKHNAEELENEAKNLGEYSLEVGAIIETLRKYKNDWREDRDDAADLLPLLKILVAKCEAKLDQQPDAKINDRIQQLHKDCKVEWDRIRGQPVTMVSARNKLPAQFTEQKDEAGSIFGQWLNVRAGDASDKFLKVFSLRTLMDYQDEFLKGFTLGTLTDSLRAYSDLLAAENNAPPDGPLPIKDVDQLLLTSKNLGSYVQKALKQGKQAGESIRVLKDKDFQEAYVENNWAGYRTGNLRFQLLDKFKRSGQDEKFLKDLLRFSICRRIDRFSGFVGKADRAIYLRLGELTHQALIHEAIHKYGGEEFLRFFGRTINEGTTELLTRAAMKDVNLESKIEGHYQDEIEIVLDINEAAKIEFELLKAAYFDDQELEKILEAIKLNAADIKKKIGEKKYQTLLEEMGTT